LWEVQSVVFVNGIYRTLKGGPAVHLLKVEEGCTGEDDPRLRVHTDHND